MSSVGFPSGKRTAYAEAQAAKQRRQMIIIGVLCVGVVGLVIYEAPSFIKLFQGSKSPPYVAPPVVTSPGTSQNTEQALSAIRRLPAADPFAGRVPSGPISSVRSVPVPPGSRDPFAEPTTAGKTIATVTPLPQQLVIGTPGAGRTASHGWIVILASIPTGSGQNAAIQFAATARQNGIAPIAVLNSSNRRPLRGGYWVVYTGPFKNLSQVSNQANVVHSRGYATAYIRELIVYS